MKKINVEKNQWPLLLIAAFGMVCFLNLQKSTAEVLHLSAFWVDLLLRGIYTVAVLYIVWLSKPVFSWGGRVIMTAFCGVVWAGYWGIGERAVLLMELAGIGVLLGYMMILARRKVAKDQGEGIEVVALLCLSIYGLKHATVMDQYTYVKDTPFWIFCLGSIIVGALLAVAATFWILWERCRERKLILEIIGCFWFFFALIFLPVGGHLNYALDLSEPILMEGTVVDHDFDLHRRGPDSYELILMLDGKEYDLEVSQEDYRAHEVGDTYEVYRFEGAFGRAFYTAIRN